MLKRASYLLAYIAPIAMIFGFWAIDGLAAPFPERIAEYLLHDPLFPLAIIVPIAAYVMIVQFDAPSDDRRDARFRTSLALLPIPVYVIVVAFILTGFRYMSWPPPTERAIPYMFSSLPAVAAVFIPLLTAAVLAYYSLEPEPRTGVMRSTIVLLSIVLLAAPGLIQFLLLRAVLGRVPGFTYIHSLAIGVLLFLAGVLLLLRTFGKSQESV